jgi:dolichyl-phosphate-mannose--protein O-mannosyl transferase
VKFNRRLLAPLDQRSTVERLRDGTLTGPLAGWLITLAVTGLAFAIRFVGLAYPNKILFDETYYAKDGYALWKFGYEYNWADDANDKIASGTPEAFGQGAEYAVHPPLAKWLIGAGEQLFGMNSFGWRFMSLIFGTLLIFFVIRLARRLSRSTLIGALAGLLLTFDGLEFVMSRLALLDIFQAVFLVAAVSCVVADRDYYRMRLADILERSGRRDFDGDFGPIVGLRPWRLAAGVMFGAALSCKWNSIFLLATMGVLSVLWDVGARRLAGAGERSWRALLVDGLPAFVRLVVVSAVLYVVSWAGWLSTSGGYLRDWAQNNPNDPLASGLTSVFGKDIGQAAASWLHLHAEILAFHTGDYMREQTHPYDAHPAGWLLMLRTIGIDAVNDIQPGVDGCTAPAGQTCLRVIDGMGTPILWWLAAASLVFGLVYWLGGRDWRFGVPLVAMLSTYLPWFANADRPVFFFYTITMVPFTVISLALALGVILGPADDPRRRRGGIIVGVVLGLVVADFAYIYPVLTDKLLWHSDWYARMWLGSWI